jgi:hypothetical protein
MNTSNKLIEIHDKKITLSTLWVFVMFCIAYADLIGYLEPGTLEKITNGNVGFTLTPAIILMISFLQAIPIVMILVSRWWGLSGWRGAGALSKPEQISRPLNFLGLASGRAQAK